MPKPLPLLAAADRSATLCCPSLASAPLGVDDAEVMASRVKALADPARLRLISILLASPDHEACTCDLTGPLGLSQPTVTHHFRTLARAGLVTAERRGTWTYYRVDSDALRAVSRVLDPSCC